MNHHQRNCWLHCKREVALIPWLDNERDRLVTCELTWDQQFQVDDRSVVSWPKMARDSGLPLQRIKGDVL
jgi:hypothetical protein